LWRLVPEQSEEEKREEQRRLERLHTRIENRRTLFGIYEWRYAFLPVGVAVAYQHFYEGDYAIRLETRQLYVFGVRVARWVAKTSLHALVKDPPKARLRLRTWRKKRGV
jgi:hypothetical protein